MAVRSGAANRLQELRRWNHTSQWSRGFPFLKAETIADRRVVCAREWDGGQGDPVKRIGKVSGVVEGIPAA